MANSSLQAARNAKNDEFYTQWVDIEREMNAYLEFDPDVFRDKVVLLPCDDPKWSNFTKFFALHFEDFGLKKLVSTSYAPRSNTAFDSLQPSLFDVADPYDSADSQYDEAMAWKNGRVFVLEREDVSGDGVVNIDDLQWTYLEGDGDFRSEEVTRLRDEADVVITNPPFSLFREFVGWLVEGGVKFSIVGTENVITYKEFFPLIRDNKVWKGATANETDMVFEVPAHLADRVKPQDKAKAERMGYVGNYTRQGVACWFTNIDHGRRHEPMQLMTMEDNRRFSKRRQIREDGYPVYDNYDGIEVGFVEAIPSDFSGLMGVPVSFLNRYNPDQFEIVGMTDRDDPFRTKNYTKADAKNYSDLNRRAAYFTADGELKGTFARVLIRHRQEEGEK